MKNKITVAALAIAALVSLVSLLAQVPVRHQRAMFAAFNLNKAKRSTGPKVTPSAFPSPTATAIPTPTATLAPTPSPTRAFAPPAAPSYARINSTLSTKVTLYWKDNASDEVTFRIERKTGSGGTYAEIGTAAANATSYADTTTAASTYYFYRVRARNADGDSSYSEEANLTTPATGRVLTAVYVYPANLYIDVGKDEVLTCAAADQNGFYFANIAPVWAIGDATKLEHRIYDEDTLARSWSYGAEYGVSYHYTTVRGVAAGTSTVGATIEGVSATLRTFTIKDQAASPVATLGGDLTNGSTLNLKVGEIAYVDLYNSTGLDTTEVNWGDGQKTTLAKKMAHVYVDVGTFTVTATVRNSASASATATATVIVSAHSAPAATATCTTFAQILTAYNSMATTGGTIYLPASITESSGLILPSRPDGVTTYITFERTGQALPALKKRINPTADAASIAALQASGSNETPVTLASNAHHIRFRGIKFNNSSGNPTGTAVHVGDSVYALITPSTNFFVTYDLANDPHHVIFEHCVVDPGDGVKLVRGLSNEGKYVSVLSSDFRNVKHDQDAQAVAGQNGTGIHAYWNCYLEATGENIMYGGGTTLTYGHVPYAIEFRKCYFPRRYSWRGNADYAYKNLFEVKTAEHVYVEGCIFTGEWSAGQQHAIILKSVNQGDDNPWSRGAWIYFENCWLDGASSALGFSQDDPMGKPSVKPGHIAFTNFLFTDIDNAYWGGSGVGFAPHSTFDITLNHCTFTEVTGNCINLNNETVNIFETVIKNSVFYSTGTFMFRNAGSPGFSGFPLETQNRYTFSKNVITTPEGSGTYPVGSQYVANLAAIGFTDYANGNYSLTSSSPGYLYATDGANSGINKTTLDAALLNTVSGNWTGTVRSWF